VDDDDKAKPGEIKIRGLKEPSSKRVKDIVEQDLNDLKATIYKMIRCSRRCLEM